MVSDDPGSPCHAHLSIFPFIDTDYYDPALRAYYEVCIYGTRR